MFKKNHQGILAFNTKKSFRKNLFDLSLKITAARQYVALGMLATFVGFD